MTAPVTAFAMLADAIKPLLPKSWHFVGYEDAVDDVDRITVVLKLQEVQRMPEAPLGAYLTSWIVTVTDPHTDPAKADPSLFDAVIDLLDDLDDLSWLRWTSAKKVLDNDRYAYDITIQTSTTKGS